MAAVRRLKKQNQIVQKISKYTIIKRLEQQDKFEQAINMLKKDELLYQKWLAVTSINSNDQNAINLFNALGLDPKIMLSA